MATAKAEARRPPAQEFEEIQRKAAGFKARGKDILAARLELEHQGIRPQEKSNSGPDPRDLAASMLDGSTVPDDRPPTPGEELFRLIVEQRAIEIAVDALAEQENQARRIAAAEAIQETAAAWREIVRRRAMAVLELRKANQEAAAFREHLRRIGGNNPNLICDVTSGPLFGPPVVGDGAYTFLESAVAAGIISKKEISNAA
ncbi:hypothetical protein NKH54_12360 [Mesorhizobium sp. M1004]|uniref:hypothetical protein n=1 Tax=Mesorhizobium sp. M1004 TaxID=2957046 RepID=UPI003338EFEB